MFEHTPVLLKESVDGLKIKPDGIYVDCTLAVRTQQPYFIKVV